MIVMCEPTCRGFVHAEVNAALVAVLNAACPADRVVFFAEPGHLQHVAEILDQQGLPPVEGRPIHLPALREPLLRFPAEWRLFREVFIAASRSAARWVVLCTLTGSGLTAATGVLGRFADLRCLAAMHGTLATIGERPKRRLKRLFWFRTALERGNGGRMRYLVFGPSIEQELRAELPWIAGQVISIDLPYFYYADPQRGECEPEGQITFGALGVGHTDKGTDLFWRLAREVSGPETRRRPEFRLVGHVVDKRVRALPAAPVIVASPDAPLSRAEFARHARAIHYAVFLYQAERYRFRASAALFDAFSFAKPVIALKTPFIQHYFERLGDIGFLCEDYDEVKAVVRAILHRGLDDRYVRQCESVARARDRFGIPALAGRLRAGLLESPGSAAIGGLHRAGS